MVKRFLILPLLLLLCSCASHRTSLYKINGEEVFLGWNDQSKLPKDAFYVLIEGDKGGINWTVKEIYDHPIKGRSNELQEVLFIDKEFRYVQPFFQVAPSTVIKYDEEVKGTLVGRSTGNGGYAVTGMNVERNAKYMDRGSWECGAVIQGDKDKYTPCTSRLTKTDLARSVGKNIFAAALTLGLASGTHQVVNKDKIAEILTQTNVFAQIKKSNLYSEMGGQ